MSKKKKKPEGRTRATLPRKDLAVTCASAALKEAYHSDRDKGWPERVGKASVLFLDVQLRMEELADRASNREVERRKLAVEERRLALLEGREKREQKAFAATQKKKKRGGPTQKDVDRVCERTFGLSTEFPSKPASSPPPGERDGAPASDMPGEPSKATGSGQARGESSALPQAPVASATRREPGVGPPVRVEKRGEVSRFPSACCDSDISAYTG
jgi:hypothetical protein